MDWFNLLAIQGTLKSLLQHHNLKASVPQHSAFFVVQFSHPYTTGKTIALTIWTLVGKVMSLFFNILSMFVIAFLPRRKCLLISWLQSPSAVILEPKKIKSVTASTVSPFICHEVIRPRCHYLSFFFFLILRYCHIFLSLHTVHEVLVILERVAISSSSGPRFVTTFHYDLSVLDGPAWHGS